MKEKKAVKLMQSDQLQSVYCLCELACMSFLDRKNQTILSR